MKRLALIGAAISTFYVTPSFASNSSVGTPYKLTPITDGAYIFSLTGTRTARPACATQDRWVIDLSTSSGQAMAASLLTALATGKQLYVVGTGTCTVWADTENVYYFEIVG